MKFRESLSQLDSQGLLTRVSRPVNPKYEIAALLKKYEGKPVLFENVTGGWYRWRATCSAAWACFAKASGSRRTSGSSG